MGKIELSREFSQKTSSECFSACVSSIEKTGYTLFKKRDIANLIICTGLINGEKVDMSMVIPMTDPTRVSVNLSADHLDDEFLQQEGDRILNIIAETLH